MQADIFNMRIVNLSGEQGLALGAAILASYGCSWYRSLQECATLFVSYDSEYTPIKENVEKYESLFILYQQVYKNTKDLSEGLRKFEESF